MPKSPDQYDTPITRRESVWNSTRAGYTPYGNRRGLKLYGNSPR